MMFRRVQNFPPIWITYLTKCAVFHEACSGSHNSLPVSCNSTTFHVSHHHLLPGVLWPPRFPSALWYPAQIQNHCWFFSSKDICQIYPPPLFYFCNFFLYTLLEHRHIRNTLVPSDLLRLFLVKHIQIFYLFFRLFMFHSHNSTDKRLNTLYEFSDFWALRNDTLLHTFESLWKQYVALQILLWTSISDPSTMAPKYGNLLTYINLDHWVIWLLIHIEMYSSSENLCLVLANSQLCRVFDQL